MDKPRRRKINIKCKQNGRILFTNELKKTGGWLTRDNYKV